MSLEDKSQTEVTGDTKGPFIQFIDCPHKKEYNCKYIDNNGKCSFETCVIDNVIPPRVVLWYFRCVICGREDAIRPAEHRVPFCRSCIQRMLKAEKLPHNCRFCGKSINSPSKWFLSGICDECDSLIKQVILYWKKRGPW